MKFDFCIGNPREPYQYGNLIYDDAIGDWRFSTQDERDLMAEDEERERLERIKKQRKQRELDEIESIMMKKEAKDKIKRKKNPFYKNNK